MKIYSTGRMVGFLIIAGLVIPPLLYWFFFLRVPSISPESARQWMQAEEDSALILDVRPPEQYARFSLQQARNIPFETLRSQPQGSWRELLQNKKHIFVICNSGFLSAQATRELRRLGYDQVLNIRGGLDAWITAGKLKQKREDMTFRTLCGEQTGLKRLTFTLFEQGAITFAGFGLKPLYEFLSLIIVILLWKTKEKDLAPLGRAMLAFFLGENACALNFLVFNEQSILLEFLHMYGMLICFGLTAYAAMEAADLRILHFSDQTHKCALLPLCRYCYKYHTVSCNLRLLFLFAVPAAALTACMPLTAHLGSYFYTGKVFINDVLFGHYAFQQILEARLFPLAALVFCGIAFLVLILKKENGLNQAKLFFAIGLGPLSFSLMRFLLFWSYAQNPLWVEAWEEISEFLFIAFVFWLMLRIRQTSRRSLPEEVAHD